MELEGNPSTGPDLSKSKMNDPSPQDVLSDTADQSQPPTALAPALQDMYRPSLEAKVIGASQQTLEPQPSPLPASRVKKKKRSPKRAGPLEHLATVEITSPVLMQETEESLEIPFFKTELEVPEEQEGCASFRFANRKRRSVRPSHLHVRRDFHDISPFAPKFDPTPPQEYQMLNI